MNEPDLHTFPEERLREFLARPHTRDIPPPPAVARIAALAFPAPRRSLRHAWICGFAAGMVAAFGAAFIGPWLYAAAQFLIPILAAACAALWPAIITLSLALETIFANPEIALPLLGLVLALLLAEIKLYLVIHRQYTRS